MNELPEDVVEAAEQGTVRIVFCERDGDGYRMTRAGVSKELEPSFRNVVEGTARRMRENEAPITYEATERPPANRYAVLDRDANEAASSLLRANLLAELDRAVNYTVLPSADLAEVRPLFYVITAHHARRVAMFGRAIAPRNVPKKSRLITAILQDDTLRHVEEEVVLFDEAVDWIYWERTLYVVNVPAFERLFLDRERLVRKTTTNVQAIMQTVKIVDHEDFAVHCAGDLNMSVRLQRIIDRGEHPKWSPAKLRAYAKRYQPAMKWEGDSIVFDRSPAHRWDIIKLLDEAWYAGELSQEHFEATSKVPAA
jgi:hypothetical protein